MASDKITKTGSINVVANTLVTTRYLKGLVPDTSIASICSVTFIEPNSAPILLPILPAKINAVITGPSSAMTATRTIAGRSDSTADSPSEGHSSVVNTRPIIKPVTAIKGND